jgi:hypothetical protein
MVSGELQPTAMVLQEGAIKWTSASSVEELREDVAQDSAHVTQDGPIQLRILPAKEFAGTIRGNQIMQIANVTVQGDVDLSSADIDHQLSIKDCVFEGHFDISEARCDKTLALSGCTFEQNVNFAGLQVEGRLLLDNVTIRAGQRNQGSAVFHQMRVHRQVYAAGLQSDVGLDFGQARLNGPFVCNSTKERPTICGGDLLLAGATIQGSVHLMGVQVKGSVRLDGALIEGDLDFEPIESLQSEIGMLSMPNVKVSGWVSLRGVHIQGDLWLSEAVLGDALLFGAKDAYRTAIDGDANLGGMHCAGELHLSGTTFKKSLQLKGARLKRGLTCRPLGGDQTEIGEFASLVGARVRGDVQWSGALIKGELNLTYISLKGNLRLSPTEQRRTEIAGDIKLVGAKVTGWCDLNGVKIQGGLLLPYANIDGAVTFSPDSGFRPEVGGHFFFYGAKLGGGLTCNGAVVKGDLDGEQAVVGVGICLSPGGGHICEIGADVNLNGTKIDGPARFIGTKINHDLLLHKSSIQGDLFCTPEGIIPTVIGRNLTLNHARLSGSATLTGLQIANDLNFQSAEVENVFCGCAGTKRTAIGGKAWFNNLKASQVDLGGCTVGGDVCLVGVHVASHFYCWTAVAPATEIGGELLLMGSRLGEARLTGSECGGRLIDLGKAQINHLQLTDRLPARVNMEGCEYQQISVPGADYLALLEATPTFHKSTYCTMEKWLRNAGRAAEADRVYLSMRRRARREGMMPLNRLGDWLLDVTIGYGLKSHRLLVYIFLMIALSCWVFSTPLSVVGIAEAKDANLHPAPDSWSTWDAIWISLETNVPFVTSMTNHKWRASSERIDLLNQQLPIRYDDYASIVSLLSWIVVPLFLAGVAGIVLRNQGN